MLKLERVSKTYHVGLLGGRELHAVRDATFDVDRGEIVSLIGESGSGKTTLGRMILRLTPVTRGQITYDGESIAAGPRRSYYRHVQGIFQDPFSSYNPIFKADHVFGMVRSTYFGAMSNSEWSGRVESALQAVGLAPEQVLHKYPHQLSGGQLQRLLIARALLLDIRLLVADEIISMLDASTRIDVLNVLANLKAQGLGILFITHDLSLGYYCSQRTVILSRGRIVEMGGTDIVYRNPVHPYTRALLASVPQLHHKWSETGPALTVAQTASPAVCLYHERYGADGNGRGDGRVDGAPALVEIEPNHQVGCFAPYMKTAC